jgi:hypothetical protein
MVIATTPDIHLARYAPGLTWPLRSPGLNIPSHSMGGDFPWQFAAGKEAHF